MNALQVLEVPLALCGDDTADPGFRVHSVHCTVICPSIGHVGLVCGRLHLARRFLPKTDELKSPKSFPSISPLCTVHTSLIMTPCAHDARYFAGLEQSTTSQMPSLTGSIYGSGFLASIGGSPAHFCSHETCCFQSEPLHYPRFAAVLRRLGMQVSAARKTQLGLTPIGKIELLFLDRVEGI